MVNLNGEDWDERIHRTNHIYLHLTRLKAGKSTQRGFFYLHDKAKLRKSRLMKCKRGRADVMS